MYHISPIFNGDEAKTQNDTYPICGICGEPHESSDCDIVRLKTTIIDTPVLSKARLSIPANLELITMADGTHSVITNELITKGTRFGPYEAKEQFSIPPTAVFPLKVFKNGDDDADDNYFKEYYLNTTNEYECNWMYFVNKANNLQEQNLICFQDNGQIYYISVRDINEKEHLNVWYAPYYGKMMKMGSYLDAPEEIADVETLPVEDIDVNALMKKQQNIRERKTWICKFCGLHEDNIQAFALHITNHYINKLRKSCEFCNARYNTAQSLKKHIFLVHNDAIHQGKIPLAIQDKQSSETSPEPQLDPLLNDVSNENNVLLEHMNCEDSTSLGNDALTLNVETILDEDENFNFEIPKEIGNESDKYACDICLKEFEKLKLLVVHLNAHTGKFTCTQCLTVFVRKENFVAHKCLNNTSTEEFKCSVCQKLFTLSKYLKRHMGRAHGQGFTCTNECKKTFGSQKTLDAHSCNGDAVPKTQTVTCHLCSKEFGNNRNLTRHLKTHEKNSSSAPPVYICEICSKQFHSMKMMKQHLTSHKSPEFACKLCDKTFQRRAAFLEHMESHKNESPHECTKCNAKFTRKKYLTNHLLSHTDELKFVCTDCPQRFKHKVNLTKHYNIAHAKTCKECAIDFETINDFKQHIQTTHSQSTSQVATANLDKSFGCPVCNTRVKLRSSLKRHIKQKHTADEYDFSTLDQYINETSKKEETSESGSQTETINQSPAKAKVEVLSNIIVKAQKNSTVVSEENKAGQSVEGQEQIQVQDTEQMQKLPTVAGSQVDSDMIHLLQANNAQVMQDLQGNLQLDEIVNVLGAKAPGPGENVLDYGSIEMEFENNFTTAVNKAAEMGITHTFDGASVCLSMPELTDANGQPVSLGGDSLQSSFILENASLNGPGEQVLVYILNQKPS